MTLWEIDIHPATGEADRAALRVAAAARELGLADDLHVAAARGFLVQGADLDRPQVERLAKSWWPIWSSRRRSSARSAMRRLVAAARAARVRECQRRANDCVTVLLKPGVMDPVAQSTLAAAADLGVPVEAVSTFRKYWFAGSERGGRSSDVSERLLANDAIEQVVVGPLPMRAARRRPAVPVRAA